MSSASDNQIISNMNKKSTEELKNLWSENNQNEYTESAFLAIKHVLEKRGEKLPPKKEFIASEAIESMNNNDRNDRVGRLSFFLIWLTLAIVNSGLVKSDVSASPIVLIIAALFSIFVMIKVGIGRLHDQNMSGWYLLGALVPFFNLIFLLFLFFAPGSKGKNRFGENPIIKKTH